MDIHKRLEGVVIRADGTVPFDDGVEHDHRARTLAWLMDQGHTIEPIHGTRHVRIKNWKPQTSSPT